MQLVMASLTYTFIACSYIKVFLDGNLVWGSRHITNLCSKDLYIVESFVALCNVKHKVFYKTYMGRVFL